MKKPYSANAPSTSSHRSGSTAAHPPASPQAFSSACAVLHVDNKADAVASAAALSPGRILLSARTGEGLDAVRAALLQRAGWQASQEGVVIARARHLQALAAARAHLVAAIAHAEQRDAVLDLLAEELRLAHRALGEITGQFSADDLLGEIFSRFCIGK